MPAARKYYLDDKLISVKELANMVNPPIKREAMVYRLKITNGDTKKAIDPEYWKQRKEKRLAKGKTLYKYKNKEYTIATLSTKFNMNRSTVARWLQIYGLDAVILYYEEGIKPHKPSDKTNQGNDEWVALKQGYRQPYTESGTGVFPAELHFQKEVN